MVQGLSSTSYISQDALAFPLRASALPDLPGVQRPDSICCVPRTPGLVTLAVLGGSQVSDVWLRRLLSSGWYTA